MSITQQESQTEIKIGDAVVLNSGSPKLTVIARSDEGVVTVSWTKTVSLPVACVRAYRAPA